jgi:hypothetical protein
MKITALSTGTLQLKPTFLEGSPAHGGPLGLIWDLRSDRSLTGPLPMWSWIIETDSERILIDAGGRPGISGGVTGTRFQISPDQALVPELARLGLSRVTSTALMTRHLHGDHVEVWPPILGECGWLMRSGVRVASRRMLGSDRAVHRGFAPRVFELTDRHCWVFPALARHVGRRDRGAPTPGHIRGTPAPGGGGPRRRAALVI